MSKEKTTKEMSVADYKLAMSKQSHRYQLLVTSIAFTIIGTVIGYFMSINVINDTQSKVVNSIQVTAVSKDQQ